MTTTPSVNVCVWYGLCGMRAAVAANTKCMSYEQKNIVPSRTSSTTCTMKRTLTERPEVKIDDAAVGINCAIVSDLVHKSGLRRTRCPARKCQQWQARAPHIHVEHMTGLTFWVLTRSEIWSQEHAIVWRQPIRKDKRYACILSRLDKLCKLHASKESEMYS